jgi:hypothetical protein
MKSTGLVAVFATGFVAGVLAGRSQPDPLPLDDPDLDLPALTAGLSGPGLSCPDDDSVSCGGSADGPLQSLLPGAGHLPAGEGPNCSERPIASHWQLGPDGAAAIIPPRSDPFWYARYRGQPLASMGQRSRIQGVEMQVAQRLTPDPPDQVLSFFRTQLELNHIQPMFGLPQGWGGPLYLSFTPEGQQMHTLILVPAQEGTLILGSLGTPDPHAKHELPAEFPAPRSVQNVHIDEIRDGQSVQRDLSFEAPGSLTEVRDFFLEQLPKRGFQSSADAAPHLPHEGSWFREFRRGAESISLTLRQPTASIVEVSAVWVMIPTSLPEGPP